MDTSQDMSYAFKKIKTNIAMFELKTENPVESGQ